MYIQWNPSYPDPAYPGTSVIRTTNLTPKIKNNINGVNLGKTEKEYINARNETEELEEEISQRL